MIMKRKLKQFLSSGLAIALGISLLQTPVTATATDAAAVTEEPEEPVIPESYYWPIQSNEIEGWPAGPQVEAETAILMDANTGSILYAKNIDEVRYPASITKIMTTLLAIEHSSLDEQVVFSENAIWGIERDSTHIGIKIGEILTMEQCLYGMMLASANEVCIAVAEHIAGSVDAFAEMMNQKAAELGCTNTHFVNANGLHDDNHYTTAHDMALIMQAAMQNDLFRQITGTTYYIVPTTNLTPDEERWLNNHHKMLRDTEFHYEGCIGGKTGFTSMAGNTLVTVAERNNMELICVVMKEVSKGGMAYKDTASLLDYGFSSFQTINIANAVTYERPPILDAERRDLGTDASTYIGGSRSVFGATIPLGASAELLVSEESLQAGQKITSYTYNSQPVGRIITDYDYVLSVSEPLPVSVPPQFNAEKADIVVEEEVTDTADPLTAFKELPAWKYPVLLVLVWAVLFLLIMLIIRIRRRSRKKEAQKKDQEYQDSLQENYEPFLTEEKILDESLIPTEDDM